jgi:OmpA-OmpF porin, OOP family
MFARRERTRSAVAPLIGVLALLAPAAASAQASMTQASGALDRFDPAPAGDTFFAVQSADVVGRLRLAASLTASYAHDPLVLREISNGKTLSWVASQALLHVQASAEILGRLKLSLDVPVMLAEGGTSGTLGPFAEEAPSGGGVGDLRAGARIALLHQDGLVPAAALTFSLWFPSGKASSFEGAGGFRYQPGVALGATYTHLVWGATVGARFSSAEAETLIGSQIVGTLGVAARWRGLTVGPEAFFGFDLGDTRTSIVSGATGTNAEILLGAHYEVGPVTFGLGAGPGLGEGPGTPRYRLLASVGGSFDALPVVAEGGGATNDTGAARPKPAEPGPTPPVDTDGDGVPDAEDACPTIVGDATPGAYRRGCPPDRDHDGIFDRDDACPDVPGVASDDPSKNGCPADSDGDGIPDDKDACPYEKGPPNADPKLNGCPTAVRVEGTQIIILQQVNFATGRAEIKSESFGLLEQVASVLLQHPEIARVAVDGHTDSQGSDKANVNLSERRAISVVTWLTGHGVDARRLEARGFGPRRPIADNKTEAGRAKNRRVEFQIRRRTTQGEAGWQDGPIDEASK